MPVSGTIKRFTGSYLLHASTIFLSAFLLFAVQPIAGKYLLPWFGGSSSVWATSLLFFTAMLFAGYLYVYILTTFGGRRQAIIHMGFVVAAAIPATLALFVWHSLFPSLLWTVGNAEAPSLSVLVALLSAIGAPYLLLSTTGPLLQYWYGMSARAQPYSLYALSNVGSLLALVSYPFLIEPFISLHREGNIWIGLFFMYVLACGIVCVIFFRTPIFQADTSASGTRAAPAWGTWLQWIVLAALPSFMLVATTTHITQAIAPVPLLWVVPLALYLMTFIIAFSGFGRPKYLALALLAAAYLAYIYTPADPHHIVVQVSSYLLLLFVCGLFCHARLYSLRPEIQRLPLFYLLLSLGGMIGALCASIMAPLFFAYLWEFPLGLALCGGLAGMHLPEGLFPRLMNRDWIKAAKIVFLFVIAVLFSNLILADNGAPTIASRNFYGPVEIHFRDIATVLMHGTTMHGFQSTSMQYAHLPSSYYLPGSGIGRALLYEQDLRTPKADLRGGAGMRVGVLGLGSASIASYCRPEDAFVFYEIDPRIEDIARTYFSYLSHCQGSSVRLGDGRMLLEKERDRGQLGAYDLVVMDAFSDDTVPAHLITLQAITLYTAHLRGPQSIIAIHTSNRYMNLPPVILRIAAHLGFNAMVVWDAGESNPLGSPTDWVLLVKDPKVFGAPVFANSNSKLPEKNDAPLWTDDYTSLFSVVNLPDQWKWPNVLYLGRW